MVIIKKNNTIIMTRADTLIAYVDILREDDEQTPYIPEDGDVVRFALKHPKLKEDGSDYEDAEPIFVKNIPIDTLELEIEPQDTKDLPFGEYVYDVELTYSTGRVYTFIPPTPFIIDKEVH